MTDYLELEKRLRQAAPKGDPHFREELRRQVLNQLETAEPSASRRRWWRLSVAGIALALLLLLIGLTPAGQIIAQAVARFGPFSLVEGPSVAEQAITATPERVYTERTISVHPGQAGQQAGFTVYYPDYLPANYLSADLPAVEMVYDRQGEVSAIEMMLFSREEKRILYYSQTPYHPDPDRPPIELGTGNAAVTPVAVGDGEGIWLPDYIWGVDSHNKPVAYNVLIWQLTTPAGESFLFWLGSEERLPLEEMLAIAESVSPVEIMSGD